MESNPNVMKYHTYRFTVNGEGGKAFGYTEEEAIAKVIDWYDQSPIHDPIDAEDVEIEKIE